MPDKHLKTLSDIATANMSYKKKIFNDYGKFISGTYCSDSEFHWRIGNENPLQFVPSIVIYHHSINNFMKFIKHEFFHGKSFARVRSKAQNFSYLKRALYAISLFFIIIKLFLKRSLSNIKNRVYISKFIKALPFLFLGIISWSLGECVGYIKTKPSKA